jgi:hypothetical protein
MGKQPKRMQRDMPGVGLLSRGAPGQEAEAGLGKMLIQTEYIAQTLLRHEFETYAIDQAHFSLVRLQQAP